MKNRNIYRFGDFTLDPAVKILLKNDEPVRMTRKTVETLLVLLESAGQVLTKDEMIAAVWPDRVVDEANLTQNVAVIRRTLGVEHGQPGFIETFPGRGYRLTGPVAVVEQPALSTAVVHTPAPKPAQAGSSLWVLVLSVVLFLGGAVSFWFARRANVTIQAPFHVVHATRLPGQELQPAISPNGQRLAFVWTREGAKGASIWVQAVGEASPHAVSGSEEGFTSPAWSPDGSRLAFLRITAEATEVHVAGADGTGARRVALLAPPAYGTQSRMLDWSPRGDLLAVSHGGQARQLPGLFLIRIATGDATQLTASGDTVGGDIDPRFSPDGASVSFIRFVSRTQQEVFLVPVAGGQARQLTSDARMISGHDWTADGKSLVIASDRSGDFRLWRLTLGARSASLAPLGVYGEFPIQLSIARRAPALVYSVLQQDRNVWRLDFGGVRWTRVIASTAQDASPQYSPSGDRVCFRSDRSGEDQLWVSGADGSNPVQVTRGDLAPSVGRWSPDGRSIVFNSSRTFGLHVATQDERGAWTVRALGVVGIHPVYAPDGQWIYAGERNGTSLLRLPAAGGAPAEVARTRAISLDISRDGAYVYFVREPNENRLWRVSTATGQVAPVLSGLLPGCTSCWSLTPSGVYFLGNSPQSLDAQTLYFHDFSTGRNRSVADYPEPLWPIGSGPFSLHPSGRSLLCVRVDPSNSDVMRVEPFR